MKAKVPNENPWRKVVFIEIASEGKHGACPWKLTLECGHIAFRTLGNAKDNMRSAQQMVGKGIQCAPSKVRCIHCGLVEQE